MDETRIDRWLCAVRLAKTRPMATQLCVGGHVTINGVSAKPSTRVRVGDRVEARLGDRERIVEVTKVIEARVGAQVAAECYVDHSPPRRHERNSRRASSRRGHRAGRASGCGESSIGCAGTARAETSAISLAVAERQTSGTSLRGAPNGPVATADRTSC